ncbi:MAG: Na/Pi cotransporter family protein [Moorea sp. SIO1F2]|uniref:Na/Pi symporter n=1 Tax=unclassified Moorena TaxID=2683338 RepID=UPI0013B6D761|nr:MULTISPECIES: Na/Pi symporter [unclassified Moorena]NEO18429.1 Na/Pi cotransporter family protein [Moorena sp. SIO4A5]NEQ58490.1 Na/Pi cotransporter family protein [Moorena sp. SIO4A1]NET83574.1 Na/Pi cotransporter family protein [Moorena sp. SIO1F2]
MESVQNSDKLVVTFYKWVGILVLVYLLIVAVGIIGTGFRSATGEQVKELFKFATNPFAGLIVGTLATALIQSSSTVTSIIVGLVAGGLPVATAVPMVMGANIGTTITNTLVSLGHIQNKDEFKQAFAAATIHDFFNLISVVIFLPLEITTHFLEKISLFLTSLVVGENSINLNNVNLIKFATAPVTDRIKTVSNILPEPFNGIALIVLGISVIFLSIFFIGKLLKTLMVGRANEMLHTAIGNGPIAGIASGTLVTVIVQSSSTTTSLIVPLAGTGLLSLQEIYPFTLGANIGTCITALLAATGITENPIPALEIATVHLLYNTLGVVIIYSIPVLRQMPILGAETLAAVATERKYLAFVYIGSVFFLIPVLLLSLSTWL